MRSNVSICTVALGAAFFAVASAQLKVGSPAPEFKVIDMSGKELFKKDFQTGGPVFIYFIRDGDPVSQEMTSFVNKIIHAYGKTRSTWYGVTNAKADRARSYEAEVSPAFTLVRDENLSMVGVFGITSAPVVFELNRRGMLVNSWKGFSADNLKSINESVAKANRKTLQAVDFSSAPSVTKMGSSYNSSTGNGG